MKQSWSLSSLILLVTAVLFCSPAFAADGGSTVVADGSINYVDDDGVTLAVTSTDRSFGATVDIEGSGFQPGEPVSVLVSHRDNPGEVYADLSTEADPSGVIKTTWTVSDLAWAGQPVTINAVGDESGTEVTATSSEIDSRLSIIEAPDTMMIGTPFEVSILLEQNCCDGLYAPMPGREVLFYAHLGDCGVDPDQVPLASAVTGADGIATATLTIDDVDYFTIGVKYEGEAEPGPDDPANSACNPDERVKIIASIDCSKIQTIFQPPQLECALDYAAFGCVSETLCYNTTVLNQGAGNLVFSIPGGRQGATIDPVTGELCFVPDYSGIHEIEIMATDSIGQTTYCTAVFDVALNEAPTVEMFPDTSFFLCNPEQICLPVGVFDVNDNIIDISTNIGTYEDGMVCFVPYYGGDFEIVVTATDACGEIAEGRATVTIKTEEYIDIQCPQDTTIFTCGADTICIPVEGVPSGDGISVDVWGLNAWWNYETQSICVLADCSYSSRLVFRVYTPCNTYTCDFDLNIVCNTDPVVILPPDTSMEICEAGEVCIPAGIYDGNDNIIDITITPGGGVFDERIGKMCFPADTSGTYVLTVTATDECGAQDSDEVTVTVDINVAPVCEVPSDTVIFLCSSSEVMLPVAATDADGNLVGCAVVDGPGAVVDGFWTYTPTTDETVSVTVRCSDDCGLYCEGTFYVTFDLNQAPEVTCPDDTAMFLCGLDDICLTGFGYSDPDQNLTDVVVTINGAQGSLVDGEVCFMPVAGANTIVVSAADDCGFQAACTSVVDVTVNSEPVCEGPSDTTLFLCGPQEVCLPLVATDIDGNLAGYELISGPGYVEVDTWCYTVEIAGTVSVTVRAYDDCGAWCDRTFNVTTDFNVAPECSVPNDTTINLCQPIEVYLPVSATDADGNLTECTVVDGPGRIANGAWTYYGSVNETVSVTVRCSDDCGEYCEKTFAVTFNINNRPVAICPGDSERLLCELTEICVDGFDYYDDDQNIADVAFTVNGVAYDLVDGRVCFMPVEGTNTIILIVTDDCGIPASCTTQVNVTLNSAPVCGDPIDTTFFQCQATEICLPLDAQDSDDNFAYYEVFSGPGSIVDGDWCYTPSGTETVQTVVRAFDDCGEFCEQPISVTFAENRPPTASCPGDETMLLCDVGVICVDGFAADDPDGNLMSAEVTVNGQPVSYDAGTVCFTPDPNANVIRLTASDSCGAEDFCETVINVTFNNAPICNVPNDTTIVQCVPAQVCLPISADDIDRNLDYCEIASGVGELIDGEWCYTPAGSGVETILVNCYDSCGAMCQSEFTVTFDVNRLPVVNDLYTAAFFCDPGEVRNLQVDAQDPDGDALIYELLSGPGSVDENTGLITYTVDAAGIFEFEVAAYDACGGDTGFVYDTITLNNPPSLVTFDSTVYLCNPEEICFEVFGSDIDEEALTISQIGGPGTFTELTDTSGETCFMPEDVDSATYIFEYCIADPCGYAKDGMAALVCPPCVPDTIRITVILNRPPEITCPPEQFFAICEPATFCFDVSAIDPDDDQLTFNVLSGNAEVNGASVCIDAVGSDQFEVVIEVVDECGHADTCMVPVTIEGNTPPTVTTAADFEKFLCETGEICFDATATDTDGNLDYTEVNFGTFDDLKGSVCFAADTAGEYTIILSAVDSCGAVDADTTVVTVTLNESPLVNLGDDIEIGLCGETEVCVDVEITDGDDNVVSVTPSIGYYDEANGRVCLPISQAGSFEIIVEVIDACQASGSDTVVITATPANPPFVDLGPDFDTLLCETAEICVDVNTIDIYETVTTNIGVFDPQTRQVCFTPDQSGLFTMIVDVLDSCGLTASDTLNMNIQVNTAPTVSGMTDSTVYLCFPTQICVPVDVFDAEDNIVSLTTSMGTYADGQVCFVPYDSGTFEIVVTAIDACGETAADTALVTIHTEQEVDIICPNDTTVFTCVSDTFCLPIYGIPPSAEVNVTGINTWYDSEQGTICFFTECGNVNHVTVDVITACGEHQCDFTVTVNCNASPLVILPPDTTVFACGPEEICVPAGVTDQDYNLSSILVSGGTYDAVAGKICIFADTVGTYNITVTATDSCGVEDSDEINITVDFNVPPYIVYDWADSVISTCTPDVCVPITIGDADGGTIEVFTDIGYYDAQTGEVCFTAETSGNYCVEVIAVDSCGAADTLLACVEVETGDFVHFVCPDDVVSAEPICGPDSVCVPVEIIGSGYEILSSVGIFEEGDLCFFADTAGMYTIELIGNAECNSDTCVMMVEVIVPEPVMITCPGDTAVLLCGVDTLCFDFSISASVGVVNVSPPAYTDGATVCVPIGAPGEHEVTMIANGACGADTCSFTVTAAFNSRPVMVAGNDTSMIVCDLFEICLPFAASDIDDNLDRVTVSEGVVNGDEICFVPDQFGTHQIIITAVDECGLVDADTVLVNLILGGDPAILCPQTTIYDTLCDADSIHVTVPISPGNATVTILPNGTYNPNTGQVAVYVDQSGSHEITIIAEAMCGVDTCHFDLDVILGEPAAVTCPGTIDTLLCLVEPVTLCYPVTYTGTEVEITATGGVFDNDQVCLEITEAGTYEVEVIGDGLCGADTCTTVINVTADQEPELFLPQESFVFERCPDDTGLICIDGIYATDAEGPLTLTQTCGPGDFELVTDDSGRVCFLPETFGSIEFCFEASDGCHTISGSFFVQIDQGEDCDVCLKLSIESGVCTPVGMSKEVTLNIESQEYLGGFDVLVAYDASVLAFVNADIAGSAIDGWEYFDYRLNAANCGSACPSGLIRFVGIAETNNGAAHPPHETLNPTGIMVNMNFQVANDQNLGGLYLPIYFAWYDCGDNSFSDTTGLYQLVDIRIYNSESVLIWDEMDDASYPEAARPMGFGTPDECFGGGKIDPVRCIEFVNGGICVIHPDSIDARGDINLNGVVYEIADAVVFSNYFVYGISVFTVNVAGQIAASDVNADGVTLSVADLVLLIRVIIGDSDPVPKLTPYAEDLVVSSSRVNETFEVETRAPGDIGAALLVYDISGDVEIGEPQLGDDARGMELLYSVEGNELRVLVMDIGTDRIASGERSLIEIPVSGDGALTLTYSEFADYQGQPYNTVHKASELPTDFNLSQNYPNPFNPSTTIEFSLPQQSEWSIRIFNVRGQLVRQFNGAAEAGYQSITWDGLSDNGSEAASGIYFYRLSATGFTDTKKMVLLK